MPYFREEDIKIKQNSWREEAHNVLVLSIRTIDKLGGREQFPELRQRLDLILNSEHWKDNYRENKGSIKNYRRQPVEAIKDAWLVDRFTCQGMQDRIKACEGTRQRLL